MSKDRLKIKNKRDVISLSFKTGKDQHVNRHEFDRMRSFSCQNLLGARLITKRRSSKLIWSCDGMISLQEYLTMVPMSRKTMTGFMEQLISLLYYFSESGFDTDRLVLDIDKVMIIPGNRKLNFIYVPVTPYGRGSDIKRFIGDLLEKSDFSPYDDNSYVDELSMILSKNGTIFLSELEEFIESLKSAGSRIGPDKKTKVRCPNCQALIDEVHVFCPLCGKTVKSDIKKPYLIKNSDSDRIVLTVFPFKIGSLPDDNNYSIRGNGSISKKHAVIIKENGKYYLQDQGSTNGTYIYGRRLAPEERAELLNGTFFSLYNEEFIFFLG